MMIPLCELATKPERTRFCLLWTMNNYPAVIIFNNFFPYRKPGENAKT